MVTRGNVKMKQNMDNLLVNIFSYLLIFLVGVGVGIILGIFFSLTVGEGYFIER